MNRSFGETVMHQENESPCRINLARAIEQAGIQYKSNIGRVLPFGIVAVLPPLGFLHSVGLGIALLFLLEGWALLALTDAVRRCNREETPSLGDILHRRTWHYLKNGVVTMIFLVPLLTVGFVALILPSIFFWSLFIFSFHHIVGRDKFAIDACMESFRSGRENRLPLFFVAAFLYLAIAALYTAAYLLFAERGWLAAVPAAFFLPYYAMIVEELFEQWETA